MAKALSVDLRRRVVDAVEAGASCRQAAARFRVGVSSAVRRVARSRQRGAPVARQARRQSALAPDRCPRAADPRLDH